MGMDVFGLKPKTEKGEYFRNNVWWWHPLWTYCCYTCPELANKVESGHDNSGDGLDAVDSRRLGFLIQESITTGAAQEYVDEYNKDTATLPDEPCFCVKESIFEIFSMSPETLFPQNSVATQAEQVATGPQGATGPESSQANVSAEGANGAQGFTQAQGTTGPQGAISLQDNIELQFPQLSGNKKPNPECHTCKGSGMQRNWNANYHIDVENIQNFAEFLIDCGGFQIC
jgi:hypothetical protein